MARRTPLKRKSFFVDERMLGRAKRVLGVSTDSEAIRLAVERMAEMEAFWQFMKNTRRTLKAGSLKAP